MGEVDFIIRMEATMRVNGKIIKWMALENFTTKEENLLMKVNGNKINLMDWVKCIMIIQ
jgi:hypothetical protein